MANPAVWATPALLNSTVHPLVINALGTNFSEIYDASYNGTIGYTFSYTDEGVQMLRYASNTLKCSRYALWTQMDSGLDGPARLVLSTLTSLATPKHHSFTAPRWPQQYR